MNEGRAALQCAIDRIRQQTSRAPTSLDEKMYLWFWEPHSLRPGGCPPGSAEVREPDPRKPQVPTRKLDVLRI